MSWTLSAEDEDEGEGGKKARNREIVRQIETETGAKSLVE